MTKLPLMFKMRLLLRDEKITDTNLRHFFHSIKKDQLTDHQYSKNNKDLVKINQNILYLNYYFKDSHFQLKYDLKEKKDSVVRILKLNEETNEVDTTFSEEIHHRKAVLRFIRKLI